MGKTLISFNKSAQYPLVNKEFGYITVDKIDYAFNLIHTKTKSGDWVVNEYKVEFAHKEPPLAKQRRESIINEYKRRSLL